MEKDIQK